MLATTLGLCGIVSCGSDDSSGGNTPEPDIVTSGGEGGDADSSSGGRSSGAGGNGSGGRSGGASGVGGGGGLGGGSDSGGTGGVVATVCGDGRIEGIEECDGPNLGGVTCESLGFASGTVECFECALLTGGCLPASGCGSNAIDGVEECDGADLGGATCASLGLGTGSLYCAGDCTFDGSSCTELDIPATWTCDSSYFGDGPCDCGCGALDYDCATANVESCDYCGSCGGASCVESVDPTSNYECLGDSTGDGWTCPPAWFEDTFCDCGCGELDPDCEDATLASCDVCATDANGGCASSSVCAESNVDPTNNAACTGD